MAYGGSGDVVRLSLPGQPDVVSTITYRSPFCHPPRWRDPAWAGERVATVVMPVPEGYAMAGQRLAIERLADLP